MFNFFKKNTTTAFEKHFIDITSLPCISECQCYKPLTAAYLFVISDFVLMGTGKLHARNENAQEIFSILENKLLSSTELKLFDRYVDLFGGIMRGAISARGDWCFSDGPSSNPIMNLYMCFGDLLKYPEYINDYANAPIVILPISKLTDFSIKFRAVPSITQSYIDNIERR